jgi:hypothetical protein
VCVLARASRFIVLCAVCKKMSKLTTPPCPIVSLVFYSLYTQYESRIVSFSMVLFDRRVFCGVWRRCFVVGGEIVIPTLFVSLVVDVTVCRCASSYRQNKWHNSIVHRCSIAVVVVLKLFCRAVVRQTRHTQRLESRFCRFYNY